MEKAFEHDKEVNSSNDKKYNLDNIVHEVPPHVTEVVKGLFRNLSAILIRIRHMKSDDKITLLGSLDDKIRILKITQSG